MVFPEENRSVSCPTPSAWSSSHPPASSGLLPGAWGSASTSARGPPPRTQPRVTQRLGGWPPGASVDSADGRHTGAPDAGHPLIPQAPIWAGARGGRWGRGQHFSSGPVGSWAHMLCRFYLRGHFVGRECWQEARAAFGSERTEPFESSVKAKEWSVPPLPAWEPRPLAGTSLARQAATSGRRHQPHPTQGRVGVRVEGREQVARGPRQPEPASC